MTEAIAQTAPAVAGQADTIPAVKPHINRAALEWVTKAKLWVDRVAKLGPINSVDEHTAAVENRKQLGIAKRQVEEVRKDHTAPFRTAVETINTFFKSPAANIDAAIEIEDKRIDTFERAEKERRRVEEARLRAEREAEARRLREEADRIEAERRAAAEKALQEAEALEAAGRIDEADQLLAAASDEATAAQHEALALESAAEIAESAPVLTAPPLSKGGLQRRTYYSAEVTDLRELVKAWLAGDAPAGCIIPDEKYLNGLARVQTSGFSIPGCKLVTTRKIGG